MTTIWKINSERIAKRHNKTTYDKISYGEAKQIGFSYCVPYTNKEALKEYRNGMAKELEEKYNRDVKKGDV
mgnify:FL=1